jgi:integrase
VSRSIHAAQGESLPYNHHLHQFLTFLKHERVRRRYDCQPRTFSETLFRLAGRRRRATVHSVAGGDYQVLHRYRGGPVEADHRLVPCTVAALVFRFASSRGWCAAGIAESIDAPRVDTYENLPQGPAWEDVKKLFTSVNGTSPVQIRSRCAILLCSVYGLRVGEVCCLRLEDIDWAEERISVRRPKQRKAQTYPLTTAVGNALLRYLKELRPRCPHREVLLTLRRPYRPVSLAQGLTLKEVSDHLGHMSVAATRMLESTPRSIWLACAKSPPWM